MKTKETKEELRTKIIESSELYSTKNRLGLFSMPVPLAIGADTYKSLKANKDESGKVIIQKRGFYTGPEKKDALPKSLFDGSCLLTDGKFKDPYVDKPNLFMGLRHSSNNPKTKKSKQRDPFCLTTSKYGIICEGNTKRYGNPYKHFSYKVKSVHRNIKDPDGKVITGKLK